MSNVQRGDAVQLQQSVDNSDGNFYVGLMSINYTLGWYNIDTAENALILWNTDPESNLPFSSQFIISDNPGLWSYTALAEKINAFSNGCNIQLNKTTGKITLIVNSNYAITFSSKLANMLGIRSTNVVTEIYFILLD